VTKEDAKRFANDLVRIANLPLTKGAYSQVVTYRDAIKLRAAIARGLFQVCAACRTDSPKPE
jgi:hypothetical protein